MTDAMSKSGPYAAGKKQRTCYLIFNNRTHERLGIMTAEELTIEGADNVLAGKNVNHLQR